MRSIVDEPRKSESRGSRTQLFPGPKTPFLAEIAPERQLFEFTVALENTPGIIEAVAAVLCKHNVNGIIGYLWSNAIRKRL